MKLWIRTQGRERLLACENICILRRKAGENIKYAMRGIEGENEIFLGDYKTKEAAMEVLDEIQKHIAHCHGVYQMPEDNVHGEVTA